jgi:hypothetical protein
VVMHVLITAVEDGHFEKQRCRDILIYGRRFATMAALYHDGTTELARPPPVGDVFKSSNEPM